MSKLLLWLANQVSMITPTTRMFGLRASLFRAGGVHVAKHAKLCATVRIPNANVSIGAATWVGPSTQLIATAEAPIRIDERCDIAPGTLLVVGSHELGTPHRRAGKGIALPITIEPGTWIGARATILGGVVVGNGCVIGACSLVTTDVASGSLVAGVPARLVRKLTL